MDENTIISKNTKHVESRLEGEIVMMNLDSGKYFNLNETGTRIWDLIHDNAKSLGQLVDELVTEYDVDREDCLSELIVFVESVRDKGILTIT